MVYGCFAVSQTAPILEGLSKKVLLAMLRVLLVMLVCAAVSRSLKRHLSLGAVWVLLVMLRALLVMLVVCGCFAVSQTAPIFRCRLGRLVKAGVAGNAEGVAGDVGGVWEVFLAMLRVMLVMLVVYGR